jgi:DNA-binding PadR family transcriptional regulator
MVTKMSRHWLHPQTIPRGFLRLYILTMLNNGSESGYSVIQKIDERTEGAWRPGAGTIYPLLKSLLKEGLVKPIGEAKAGGAKAYAITTKGKAELQKAREMFAGAGRREPVMARLFADLLPGELFAQMVVRRMRDNADNFRQKLSEVPEPARTALLTELRFLTESQAQWIESQLAKPNVPRRNPR